MMIASQNWLQMDWFERGFISLQYSTQKEAFHAWNTSFVLNPLVTAESAPSERCSNDNQEDKENQDCTDSVSAALAVTETSNYSAHRNSSFTIKIKYFYVALSPLVWTFLP